MTAPPGDAQAAGGIRAVPPPAAEDDVWARRCWQLFALAAATFLLLLFRVQATGEEAVYSVEAYEQWYAHDWLRPTFLGGFYQRPPLFTDLIALLSSLIGWQYCLAAARLISSLATIASGLMVAAFAMRSGASRGQAAFSGLICLTLAEPLFYYGWLGYSDALFGTLVLGAMLGTWLAVRERLAGWLVAALLLAFAGFLTKALTAYVFVGAAGLLCLWHYRAWDCLRRPAFWLALAPLALPALWYANAPTGNVMAHGMLSDITGKLGHQGAGAWLRHFGGMAANALLNLLPAAGLAICVLWTGWHQRNRESGNAIPSEGVAPRTDDTTRVAGAIALLNFLPYWLAPQGGPRYLMPLYGLMALWFSGLLWPSPRYRRWLLRWLLAAIALKVLAGAWLFPAYTARVRPDLAAIAASVQGEQEAHAHAPVLYANTDAWVGLSVVALLDTQPPGPRAPLVRPHDATWTDALLLSDHHEDSAPPSRLVKDYGGVQLYCRGSACR